jgi:hypothetical protein
MTRHNIKTPWYVRLSSLTLVLGQAGKPDVLDIYGGSLKYWCPPLHSDGNIQFISPFVTNASRPEDRNGDKFSF